MRWRPKQWFCGVSTGHTRVNGRDEHGKLIYRCVDCGHLQPVLASAVVTGPQSTPAAVLGKPQLRAQVLRQGNVRKFERQSEQ